MILFGWRALGAMFVVMLSAACAAFIWRSVGARGHQLRYAHTVWLGFEVLYGAHPAHKY